MSCFPIRPYIVVFSRYYAVTDSVSMSSPSIPSFRSRHFSPGLRPFRLSFLPSFLPTPLHRDRTRLFDKFNNGDVVPFDSREPFSAYGPQQDEVTISFLGRVPYIRATTLDRIPPNEATLANPTQCLPTRDPDQVDGQAARRCDGLTNIRLDF
jgi:hypothetical protein